jgi:ribonuclease HI
MELLDSVEAYSDGASRGNPGPAAVAYVIYDDKGALIDLGSRLIGTATNNEAEYQALILAMERACSRCRSSAHFFLDSELLVRQFNGQYRAKDPRMKEYLDRVIEISRCFREVKLTHVPRENRGAQLVDRMVNEALDRAR